MVHRLVLMVPRRGVAVAGVKLREVAQAVMVWSALVFGIDGGQNENCPM